MEFWVHRNGEYAGRFSEPDIRQKVAEGAFSRGDLVWDAARSAWQPIAEFLDQRQAVAPSAASPGSELQRDAGAAPTDVRPIPAARSGPPPLPATTTTPAAAPPPLPS